ncbi:MAG: ABC transporter ATP-binding protein [Phycisphaerales bacterium]
MTAAVLDVDRLTMRFGGLTAVQEVSFGVRRGEIVSVIGPNGAGKTTVFNAVTGIYAPTDGCVRFEGGEVRKPLRGATIAGFVAVAALTAVGAVLAINAEALWKAAILDHFVYRQPFPWMEAARDGLALLARLSPWRTVAPALLAAIVGAAGAFVVWQRSRRTPAVVAARGMSRTFQNIRLFGEMTLVENVLVGMDTRLRTGMLDAILRLPRFWRERRESEAKALELLRFVDLGAKAREMARNLPYGHQRRLEIARALASEPTVLLLDEPAAGMNPAEAVDLMGLIRKVRDRGVTVVLIEHHMKVVMGISDRIVVLNFGKKIAEGTPEAIRSDEHVQEIYLGKHDEAGKEDLG